MICEWCVLFHFTVTIFDISCFQKFKIYGVYDGINNCGAALLMAIMSNFALADCFDRAWSYYSIDPDYLRAISRQNLVSITLLSMGKVQEVRPITVWYKSIAEPFRIYEENILSSTRISSTLARACVFMLVLCFYGVILV